MRKSRWGKHAVGIDDVSGFKVKHNRLKKKWNGFMTVPGPDFEDKHPLLDSRGRTDRIYMIPNPRPGQQSESSTSIMQLMLKNTPDIFLYAGLPNFIYDMSTCFCWYLGPFSSAPTTDNDGESLIVGHLYFNTVDVEMYYFDGNEWQSWMDTMGVRAIDTLVDRDLSTRFLEKLNLLDFGADPTGVDLCDDAIEQWIQYAEDRPETPMVLYVPAGTYRVSNRFPTINRHQLSIKGDSRSSTTFVRDTGTEGGFIVIGNNDNESSTQDIEISDLGFKCLNDPTGTVTTEIDSDTGTGSEDTFTFTFTSRVRSEYLVTITVGGVEAIIDEDFTASCSHIDNSVEIVFNIPPSNGVSIVATLNLANPNPVFDVVWALRWKIQNIKIDNVAQLYKLGGINRCNIGMIENVVGTFRHTIDSEENPVSTFKYGLGRHFGLVRSSGPFRFRIAHLIATGPHNADTHWGWVPDNPDGNTSPQLGGAVVDTQLIEEVAVASFSSNGIGREDIIRTGDGFTTEFVIEFPFVVTEDMHTAVLLTGINFPRPENWEVSGIGTDTLTYTFYVAPPDQVEITFRIVYARVANGQLSSIELDNTNGFIVNMFFKECIGDHSTFAGIWSHSDPDVDGEYRGNVRNHNFINCRMASDNGHAARFEMLASTLVRGVNIIGGFYGVRGGDSMFYFNSTNSRGTILNGANLGESGTWSETRDAYVYIGPFQDNISIINNVMGSLVGDEDSEALLAKYPIEIDNPDITNIIIENNQCGALDGFNKLLKEPDLVLDILTITNIITNYNEDLESGNLNVIFQTSTDHNLTINQRIIISGIVDTVGGLTPSMLNGEWFVNSIMTNNRFAIVSSNRPTSSENSSSSGTIQVFNTAYRRYFNIMNGATLTTDNTVTVVFDTNIIEDDFIWDPNDQVVLTNLPGSTINGIPNSEFESPPIQVSNISGDTVDLILTTTASSSSSVDITGANLEIWNQARPYNMIVKGNTPEGTFTDNIGILNQVTSDELNGSELIALARPSVIINRLRDVSIRLDELVTYLIDQINSLDGILFDPEVGTSTYRLVTDKLREIKSVEDFRISTDSLSDHTTIFNRAIAWINAGTGTRDLFIPSGIYTISEELDPITVLRGTIYGTGESSHIRMSSTPTPSDAGIFWTIGQTGSTLMQNFTIRDIQVSNLNTASPTNPTFLINNAANVSIMNIRCNNISQLCRIGDDNQCIRLRMERIKGSYRGLQSAHVLHLKRAQTALIRDISLSANDGAATGGSSVFIECLPVSGTPLIDTIFLDDVHIINFNGCPNGLIVNLDNAELNKLFVNRCYFNFVSTNPSIQIRSDATGYNIGVARFNGCHTHRVSDGGAVILDNQSGEGWYDISFTECQLRSWGTAPAFETSGDDIWGLCLTNNNITRLGGSGFPNALVSLGTSYATIIGGSIGPINMDSAYTGSFAIETTADIDHIYVAGVKKPTGVDWIDHFAYSTGGTDIIINEEDHTTLLEDHTKLVLSETTQTLTDAANITMDVESGWNGEVTITASRTLDLPSNLVGNEHGYIDIIEDGTGGWSISYGAGWVFSGTGSGPTIQISAGIRTRLLWRALSPSSAIIYSAVNWMPATFGQIQTGTQTMVTITPSSFNSWRSNITTLTDAANIVSNMNTGGPHFMVTLTANRNFNAPFNVGAGKEGYFIIYQDGVGGHIPTWDSVFKNTTLLLFTTTLNTYTLIKYWCKSSTEIVLTQIGTGLT